MTAKGIYEAVLTEMNKLLAPSITLEDFNYFANKAISQYINKRYNIYDVNLLTTDDLRVLKATTMLTPLRAYVGDEKAQDAELIKSLYGATYEVNLPDDYLHMLNCICVFKVNAQHKCYNKGEYLQFGASRLTADAWSLIINNFYMKPSYKRPYYYIHNVNTDTDVPTNPIKLDLNGLITSGTDYSQASQSTSMSILYMLKGGIVVDKETKEEEIEQFYPSTYEFKSADFTTVANNILNNITVDRKIYIVLAIPVNAKIQSIYEENTGDLTALYTGRFYKEEPIIDHENTKLKLVFIGTGHSISGKYTIKIINE